MGMFDKFDKLFKKKKIKTTDKKTAMSEKEKATAKGEPYVRVVEVELNPENPSEGYFELDWNTPFVQKLREAGYSGTTEEEIVDGWFTALCRNIGEAEDI